MRKEKTQKKQEKKIKKKNTKKTRKKNQKKNRKKKIKKKIKKKTSFSFSPSSKEQHVKQQLYNVVVIVLPMSLIHLIPIFDLFFF